MDTLIVSYDLKPGRTETDFEAWLRAVDSPSYARLRSMRNPRYYRAGPSLDDATDAGARYVVLIGIDDPAAVETEMAQPEWAGFVADFEARTADARFVAAQRFA